jgi:hypothetical protein
MKVELIYNELKKDIEIDFTIKVGKIQENILNICSLIIYNIEYSEIIINEKTYIIGKDIDFNETFEDFFNNNNISDIKIDYIIIKDRNRTEDGDVVKENQIIDNYNKWYKINETYLYLNNVSNIYNINPNPFINILNNILNIPIDNNFEQSNENIQESNINNFINIYDNYILDSNILRRIPLNLQNNLLNNPLIESIDYQLNNPLNNLLDSSQDDLQDDSQDDSQDELPELISYENINNIQTLFNITNFTLNGDNVPLNLENVKVILNNEQFENLETIEYKKIDNKELMKCLICIEDFNDNDIIKKIKCNHIFHTNCIKGWLCKESNKCPICRVEVDKGIYEGL